MNVTMKDIASKLGISINAVSLALNNKTGVSDDLRFQVLRTAEQMGYLRKKAKFMRTFAQTNLCVMMQQLYSKDMNFYGKVLFSITEETRKNGFDTIIHFFDDDSLIVPNCIAEYRVSGVIVIGKICDKNIEVLKSYDVPIVLVDHASLKKTMNCIVIDNKLGGFIATNYLIENNLDQIGFFGDLDYSLSIKERFFGFREAIATSRILKNTTDVDNYVKRYSITKNIEQAVLANDNDKIVALLRTAKELPQAFVCSNDFAAIALLVALQSLGYKVPEDVSIIGFDNIEMTDKVNPKISTLNVDKEKMGVRAVQRVKELINGSNISPESITLSVELVEKQSVLINRNSL